ncbi:zinc-ribbon domain-containing protein [Lactobacillus sp. PSON]|uniref:zinc-ribbon domain-containing protein n=1 Tax=Lactobacillus sp. PSON TaxID=3455454 RepID=UPI004040F96B
MKNFCPKCGNSLKPNAKFCPKCGTKIESKVSPRQNITEQVVQQVPKKPKKFKNYKAFIIAMAVIIVAIAGGFGFVIYQKNSQASKATSVLTHKSNKAATKKTNNAAQSAAQSDNQSASQNDSNYSIDEWMLMGYMAYAHDNYVESRHISGTSDLVEDVGEDIANSDLKVDKNSDTSYTLTNKFGSVDVDVDSNDVKVKADNGDEVTTDKDKLEDTFSSYKGQIQKMTSYIKSGNSDSKEDNNENTASESKSSIPGDEGMFTVPTAMQGTWYGYSMSLQVKDSNASVEETFGKHTVSSGKTTTELRLQSAKYSRDTVTRDYVDSQEGKQVGKETENIGATYPISSGGIKGFSIKGWLQIDGGHQYYAPYTLKGQPVVLSGQVQNYPEIREVLWKSPELAKEYKNTKFPEIDELNKKFAEN